MPEPDDDIADELKELVDFTTARVRLLVTGAHTDVRAYAVAIVRNLAAAAAEPADKREALLKELGAQTLLLAEVQRLRAVNASWEVIDRAIQAGLAIALRAVDSAL